MRTKGTDTKTMPKIGPTRRRLGSIGRKVGVTDGQSGTKHSVDLDEQRKALASRQPSLYYNVASEDGHA